MKLAPRSPVPDAESQISPKRWYSPIVRIFDGWKPDLVELAEEEEGVRRWRWAPGFMAMHLACGLALVSGVSTPAVVVAILLYVLRMFAITGFYHRYFSHRSFKTSRSFQFVMGLWGTMAMQKGPLWWAAHHRHHHRYSDEPEDIHSPKQQGFWWSHLGWFTAPSAYRTRTENIPDLMRFPEMRWLDRYALFPPVFMAAGLYGLGVLWNHLDPAAGTSGFQMLVWGLFISTVALYHGTYAINSLAHVFGRRRYKTTDTSRNSLLLSIITLGEGWHNNHHHYPGAVRQGFYWWEIDLTWYGLKLFQALGLIWDLNKVPEAVKKRHSAKLSMDPALHDRRKAS